MPNKQENDRPGQRNFVVVALLAFFFVSFTLCLYSNIFLFRFGRIFFIHNVRVYIIYDCWARTLWSVCCCLLVCLPICIGLKHSMPRACRKIRRRAWNLWNFNWNLAVICRGNLSFASNMKKKQKIEEWDSCRLSGENVFFLECVGAIASA